MCVNKRSQRVGLWIKSSVVVRQTVACGNGLWCYRQGVGCTTEFNPERRFVKLRSGL